MKRLLLACALALGACDLQIRDTFVEARAATLPADLPAFFDCLRENGQSIVSAHRGGPAPGFAENAIATFENTLRQAPAFLEVDVTRTRDGVLVLMHDDTVDRTTTGAGAVRDLTAAQFAALQLRDDEGQTLGGHPPTLREALAWADGRTVLELDVKRGVSYEHVAREVEAANAMSRVVFITYSADGAIRLARVAPAAMIYTTIENERDLAQLTRANVDLSRIIAWVGAGDLDPALLAALAARGVETRAGRFGASRSPGRYMAAARAGVSSIAVDEPAAAVRELDQHDGADGYAALQCMSAR